MAHRSHRHRGGAPGARITRLEHYKHVLQKPEPPQSGPRSDARRAPGTSGQPHLPDLLAAINAQITGTRILALIVLVVLLGGGIYSVRDNRLAGDRAVFIALALVLCVTTYMFIQVMYLFTGKR